MEKSNLINKKKNNMLSLFNLIRFTAALFMIILAVPYGIRVKAAKITTSVETVCAGKKVKFGAEPGIAGGSVTWSVDKTKYASINSKGKFTAKRAGKVKVTVSDSLGSDTVTVNITPKKVVAIDAGHQKKGDSSTEPIGQGASMKKPKVAGGTSGVYTKVPEYKLTLTVAKKLKRQLVSRGYKVVMIRTKDDVNISNKERAQKANETSDICIRLHADGSSDSSVSGASALYPSSSNKYVGKLSKSCKALSDSVLSAMCKKSGARNRGLSQRDDLTGTNWSSIPVTLIEMGFMTNKSEDIRLQDDNYQKKLAIGMAEGVEKYFGY